MLTLPNRPDPLSVLSTTLLVVEQAESVQIDLEAVQRLAGNLVHQEVPAAEWETGLHWSGDPESTANYVLVLDALNFSFWGEPRWVVSYGGQRYNGYWALAAALKRALEAGIPLTNAAYLATIDEATLGQILAGEHPIPLLAERANNLRELGRVLLEGYDGRFTRMISAAQGSAVRLVQRVAAELPSFNDVASYHGREVRFYKRAQILAGDLAGAFGGRGPGHFHDLDQLTAFADYKVPQVLHHLGLITYDAHLEHLLAERADLAAGDPREVEIRAATIWSVEAIRRALAAYGVLRPPYQLDWMLWQLGQNLPSGVLPYHRTRTIFY